MYTNKIFGKKNNTIKEIWEMTKDNKLNEKTLSIDK